MTALRTGAELVVAALEDEGIALAFGIPGTHNIELYHALHASPSVRAVLVTDEQSASFMGDGAFRASGRMACVNVVPGAGLTHPPRCAFSAHRSSLAPSDLQPTPVA